MSPDAVMTTPSRDSRTPETPPYAAANTFFQSRLAALFRDARDEAGNRLLRRAVRPLAEVGHSLLSQRPAFAESDSFEIASSIVKVFGFWMIGKSLKVAANLSATMNEPNRM